MRFLTSLMLTCVLTAVAAPASAAIDRAIADFASAIKANPKFAGAYYNRGLARQAKADLGGAIADFTKAIQYGPEFADAYYARAQVRSTNGERDRAVADLTEAVRLEPKNEQMAAMLKQLNP
jgi:tetratricopeptide (TPR) repeat protein